MTHSHRLLVIGLDGATYDMLTPLAALGRLPNLAVLMRESLLASARSTLPAITPVAWSTFQTGCDPHEHGIWDYRYLEHSSRRILLNQSGRLQRPTIFDVVSSRGESVVSINLPMTFPVPAGLNGMMIGGLDSPSSAAALAPYPDFARQLQSRGVRLGLETVWKEVPQSLGDVQRGVAATIADFHGRAAAAAIADELVDWRLMMVQFQTLDCLQHRCLHLLDLESGTTTTAGPPAPPAWRSEITRALKALDDAVGDLIQLAERRGAAVAVVSDHGFGPFRAQVNLPELLTRGGMLQWPGSSSRFGYRMQRTAWKLRKSLTRRLRPGANLGALSRPLDALLPIDWQRSAAITLHGSLGALVYLNTPARFGDGPIDTEQNREQAMIDLTALFQNATHPETGERLFVEVIDLGQQYDRDPVAAEWPDLLAIPADGFHTRHKRDQGSALLRDDPTLTGTHRREGVFMLRAAGVQSNLPINMDLRDVAPTLLQTLGIQPPTSMSGQALAAVATLSTETGVRLPSLDSVTLRSVPQAPADDDQALVEARLRDLGYME